MALTKVGIKKNIELCDKNMRSREIEEEMISDYIEKGNFKDVLDFDKFAVENGYNEYAELKFEVGAWGAFEQIEKVKAKIKADKAQYIRMLDAADKKERKQDKKKGIEPPMMSQEDADRVAKKVAQEKEGIEESSPVLLGPELKEENTEEKNKDVQ